MGQANRRSKKQRGFKRPSSSFNLDGLKAKFCDSLFQAKQRWKNFPRFNRYALIILIPIFIMLWILPSSDELENQMHNNVTKRQDIPLNIGTQTTDNQTQGGKLVSSDTKSQRRDIVLDHADIRDDKTMDAVGGTEDNGPRPETKPMESKIYPINGGKVFEKESKTDKPTVKSSSSNTPPIATNQPVGVAGKWYSHKILSGETLANIFREKSLPLSDLYAIAKVQGPGNPISQVQAGQILSYRQNSQGEINGLTIVGNGSSASFYLGIDGNYYRK